jgi:hypothetical protein
MFFFYTIGGSLVCFLYYRVASICAFNEFELLIKKRKENHVRMSCLTDMLVNISFCLNKKKKKKLLLIDCLVSAFVWKGTK